MTKVPVWFRLAVFGVLLAATVAWVGFSEESFVGSPGLQGDDVYFENIAYHLAKGEGITFDFRDEDWRRSYRDANANGQNDWVFYLQVRGPTTSRSPGFPLLVAAIYKVYGRDWMAVRIVVSVLLASALTFLIGCTVRHYGWIAGIMAALTLACDYYILRTAGQFMTEGLGAVVVSMLFCVIIRLAQRPNDLSPRARMLGWFGVGLLYGFGILVRANLNAWLIIVVFGLVFLIVCLWLRKRSALWLIWPSVAFGIGVALTAGPWWIRNCVVTRAFAPFGTSGSFGIAGGYSDQAYENFGNWDPKIVDQAQEQTLARPGIFQKTLPEQEYQMGRDSTALARKWIAENREKVPLLMLMKAYSHLGFYRQPLPLVWINGLMIFGAAIGCYASRNSLGIWIILFIGLSVISTTLTWSHYGRYSIPIRPLIHVACAIGTVEFWALAFRWFGVIGQSRDKPAASI